MVGEEGGRKTSTDVLAVFSVAFINLSAHISSTRFKSFLPFNIFVIYRFKLIEMEMHTKKQKS